jgi:hypothetical protein
MSEKIYELNGLNTLFGSIAFFGLRILPDIDIVIYPDM